MTASTNDRDPSAARGESQPQFRVASRAAAWVSYDSVAAVYERVAVRLYEPLARDLVGTMALRRAAIVLDVGTGTGLVAGLVSTVVDATARTIGIDPSVEMLRVGCTRRGITTAAAEVPGLPFADATFDAVVANLVISHIPDLSAGLADMVRVLRPGGRLGVTASAPDPAGRNQELAEADEIVASVRDAYGLPSEVPERAAPWEEVLRDRHHLVSRLAQAGLLDVDATAHTYDYVLTLDEYLSGRESLGRYLRWQAGEQRWRDFSDRAREEVRRRIGGTIPCVKSAWVAAGVAP